MKPTPLGVVTHLGLVICAPTLGLRLRADRLMDWRAHCHHYNACNRPVYFVRSNEYEAGYRRHDQRYDRDARRYDPHYDRHDDHHDNP